MKDYLVMADAIQRLIFKGLIDQRQLTTEIQKVAAQFNAANVLDELDDLYGLPNHINRLRGCVVYDIHNTTISKSFTTSVKKSVRFGDFKRHLQFKRIARRLKYGIQKGHKKSFKFDRVDARLYKRAQRDALVLVEE